MMQKFRITLLALGFLAGLTAEEAVPVSGNPVPPGPPPPMHGGPRMHWNGGNMYWRVFNRMSREERRTMMELQAKDPAAFQQQMKQRAEALRKADEELRQKIEGLARRCRTGSAEEKLAARKELARIFREGYQRRLADSRRHLQEMQRRMQKLAESLKEREANADQEIEKIVENCIQGRKPEAPPRRHGSWRMEPPPPEMMPPPPDKEK